MTTKNRLRSNFKLLAFFSMRVVFLTKIFTPFFFKEREEFFIFTKKIVFLSKKKIYISRDSTPFFFKYIDFFKFTEPFVSICSGV